MKALGTIAGLLLMAAPLGSAAGQTNSTAAGATSAPSVQAPVSIARTTFIADMDAEFHRMDADHNGILTKKEIVDFQRAAFAVLYQQRVAALFQQLDVDRNGQLSPGEFAAIQLPRATPSAGPLLTQTDLNHDGQITLVEFRRGKLANFDQMDTDQDGVVSQAEMKAAGVIR